MLISEFCRRTGLPRDTVRLYARRGLLRPRSGEKGGVDRYQEFSDSDLEAAQIIQVGKTLGMSLAALATLLDDNRSGRMTPERLTQYLETQRSMIEAKIRTLTGLSQYLSAKITWVKDGTGTAPVMRDFLMN